MSGTKMEQNYEGAYKVNLNKKTNYQSIYVSDDPQTKNYTLLLYVELACQ